VMILRLNGPFGVPFRAYVSGYKTRTPPLVNTGVVNSQADPFAGGTEKRAVLAEIGEPLPVVAAPVTGATANGALRGLRHSCLRYPEVSKYKYLKRRTP